MGGDDTTSTTDDSTEFDKVSSVDSCEWSVHSNSPIWMPDESAPSCTKCNEPFNMFRRRHHCRACGEVCCAQCAPRTSHAWPTLFKQNPQPTFKRLCKDCSEGLSSSEYTPKSTLVEKN